MKWANSQKKIKDISSLIDRQRMRQEFNLDEEIEKLEMNLQTVEFNYSRSTRDINQTIEKIEDGLKNDHMKTDRIIENCFQQMENNVLAKLVTEKDRIIQNHSLLKKYTSDKSAVFKHIFKQQLASQTAIISNAEGMITKQTNQIRQTLQRTFRGDPKNVGSNPPILHNLKQKIGSLAGELKKFEERNKTLEKKTQIQLKEMMQVFQEIEDARGDRQLKEEQIILLLEEMSGQNTLQ